MHIAFPQEITFTCFIYFDTDCLAPCLGFSESLSMKKITVYLGMHLPLVPASCSFFIRAHQQIFLPLAFCTIFFELVFWSYLLCALHLKIPFPCFFFNLLGLNELCKSDLSFCSVYIFVWLTRQLDLTELLPAIASHC